MRLLKRLLALVILALVLVFGVLFTVQNTDRAPLDLLIVQLSAQRVSLWIMLAFIAGGVIGLLISSVAILRLKSSVLLLQRKLNKQEQALSTPPAEDHRSPAIQR